MIPTQMQRTGPDVVKIRRGAVIAYPNRIALTAAKRLFAAADSSRGTVTVRGLDLDESQVDAALALLADVCEPVPCRWAGCPEMVTPPAEDCPDHDEARAGLRSAR